MQINFIRNFIKLESAGGIVLFAAALVAIVIDNSLLAPYMEHLLETPISIQIGDHTLSKHLLHWVNDGLMVAFFLLVGLEIKREFIKGELNSSAKVMLPAIAAFGGMLVPALIFVAFNANDSYALRGWAIPTATDIAFSLGILSLLGKRVPISLKIFLTALAIFDDMGAILVIALFYTQKISFLALALAGTAAIALFILNRLKVQSYAAYFLVGIFLWLCFIKSGVHATLAGVILAFAIPIEGKHKHINNFSPSEHLEHKLHPWIAFMVLPIFAFANAGVSLFDVPPGWGNIFSPVMLGIALGLFIGKLVGVFGATFLAVKLNIAKKPRGASWTQLLGVSMICGVGFTMSFFVGSLAYLPDPEITQPFSAWVRMGVLLGSLLSAVFGYLVLYFHSKNDDQATNEQ